MRSVFVEPVVSHVASQFQRPRGPLGALAGRIMSNRNSNSQRNIWLVELLKLQPEHRVLEIGPGPGVAIQAAARKVTDGELVAIDHSTTMLRQTGHRNQDLLDAGRLRLIEGTAQDIPSDVTGFDRIYCMNVWQFWEDQETDVVDLANRLNPGGRLAIGYQPRHPGATSADADAARRCLRDQLKDAGLQDITDHRINLEPPVVAVIGSRA